MSQLVRLIYASKAAFQPQPASQGIDPKVGRILTQSRANNPKQQIGGVLFYGDGYFFQCLEGERKAVETTYQRIAKDERHTDLSILQINPVTQRLFSNWSMKHIPSEQPVRAMLAEFGYKQFTPFQFDAVMIDKMLHVLARADDPNGNQPVTHNKPWWRRLFG